MGVAQDLIALAQGGEPEFTDVSFPVTPDTSQETKLLQRDPETSVFSFSGRAQEELSGMPPLANINLRVHLEQAENCLAGKDYPGCTLHMEMAKALARRFSANHLRQEIDNRIQEVADHANGTHEADFADRHVDGESEQDNDEHPDLRQGPNTPLTALGRVTSAHELRLAWSPEARAAALKSRESHGGMSNNFKHAGEMSKDELTRHLGAEHGGGAQAPGRRVGPRLNSHAAMVTHHDTMHDMLAKGSPGVEQGIAHTHGGAAAPRPSRMSTTGAGSHYGGFTAAADQVLAMARGYERVEHGRVEHVGAYASARSHLENALALHAQGDHSGALAHMSQAYGVSDHLDAKLDRAHAAIARGDSDSARCTSERRLSMRAAKRHRTVSSPRSSTTAA